jgi:hypothetical protein
MRSVQYQIKIAEDNVRSWTRKVEHSIRALKDDEKNGNEWTVMHLSNLQDDIHLLDRFIEHYATVRLMRDADDWPEYGNK